MAAKTVAKRWLAASEESIWRIQSKLRLAGESSAAAGIEEKRKAPKILTFFSANSTVGWLR